MVALAVPLLQVHPFSTVGIVAAMQLDALVTLLNLNCSHPQADDSHFEEPRLHQSAPPNDEGNQPRSKVQHLQRSSFSIPIAESGALSHAATLFDCLDAPPIKALM